MQSAQESKQELEAAIRYAENAISSANKTIESMEFRQEMAKKQYAEQTGREELLTKQVQELNATVQFHIDREAGFLDQIKRLERELEHQQVQGQGYYDSMRECMEELEKLRKEKEASSGPCGCQAYRDLEERATMPVIPKDVAIAIFREGVQSGVNDAVAELEGQTINICENEYCGDFEVTFAKDIHLDDELDLDWMRGKVGQYNEEFVVDALKGLCADKEFECRIHGIDEQES
jgi:predicted RNase H-like nuclease (RuvC/YqgF family)